MHSRDGGLLWTTPPSRLALWSAGRRIDRVPHDYQRIVPDFRGDGRALSPPNPPPSPARPAAARPATAEPPASERAAGTDV